MIRSIIGALIFCFFMVTAAPAQVSQLPQLAGPGSHVLHGGNIQTLKSARDSFYLIGPWSSSAPINGQFEDRWGIPDWNGWTHHDLTAPEVSRWNVSTFHADNLAGHGAGNLAAWCGESTYPACGAGDQEGGYGNNYDDILGWTGVVANPEAPCTVTVDAWLNCDLENGRDYLSLRYHRNDDHPLTVFRLDGRAFNKHLQESFVVEPGEYLGETDLKNQIKLEFRVTSDTAFSDEDCFYPSVGACQIDDITVTLSNGGLVSFEDFESAQGGDWEAVPTVGVGDFAQIFWALDEIDPCASNWTPQVCFIDDGIIVPGTGGQICLNWCYGPNGYIVNTEGGLAGPESYLHNQIRSPVIEWPASGAEGAILTYGVFEHEDLGFDSPGIFHTWHVRSTSSSDPGALAGNPWRDRNYVYYGPGQYIRPTRDITDLLEPGTTFAQVAFSVRELGYIWGLEGDDGYPAPYFDNVQLVAFPFAGPSISARQIDLAQDGFPAGGVLDQANPANNSVRFDMAGNIAPPQDGHLDPGDSIIATVVARRLGADLLGKPRLRYKLEPNPVFDEYRSSGLANEGYVEGFSRQIFSDKFAFDLPDSGFFFPGDVLHYFIEATSDLAGSQLTAILPADTSGFADFSGPLAYNPGFTVRALPSVNYNAFDDSLEHTHNVLLWEDGDDLETWAETLAEIGSQLHYGYDLFQTRDPSAGVGNGLGSRATGELLAGYRSLLYTSGLTGSSTISNGDLHTDGSNDVDLLDAWMNSGGKSMFLTGDNLVSDLAQSGSATSAFAANWMRVSHLNSDLRPFINGQSAPRVVVESNPVFFTADSWIAYGGCPYINTFDGLDVLVGGQRIAQFTDPGGNPGNYQYSAATLNDLEEDKTVIPPHNSAVISLPYDLQFIYTDPQGFPPPGVSARQAVLFDVLYYFGEIITWDAVDIPGPARLEARNYPNPFNPATRIEYSLPRPGHLSVKVFNLRGHLVRTLIDEKHEAGSGNVLWDGSDDRGAAMSSGVYFYEVRAGSEVVVRKMALLK